TASLIAATSRGTPRRWPTLPSPPRAARPRRSSRSSPCAPTAARSRRPSAQARSWPAPSASKQRRRSRERSGGRALPCPSLASHHPHHGPHGRAALIHRDLRVPLAGLLVRMADQRLAHQLACVLPHEVVPRVAEHVHPRSPVEVDLCHLAHAQ